ncbi:Conserved hypothetical protein [Micromonospora lupini str. Lupac 08]|uniref:Uncharacterized protein n=1 Tax=Micromonospora lupini str. Lupac 08 TaxID=1150864 RepID=I0L699_9ACTN|nr:Conserved hypothetical protein [Micromonospora lupini str. Lupac 08]
MQPLRAGHGTRDRNHGPRGSSIVVTADTYTSVLPQIQRRCADATAQLVLNAARRTRKKIEASARKNRPDRSPKAGTPAPTKPKQVLRPHRSASRPQSRRSRPDKPARTPSPGLHPHRTHVTPTVHAGQPARRA